MRDALSEIIKVAAELATGKWLLSEYGADYDKRVSKAMLTKINVQNEHARLAAIRLRKSWDALSPAHSPALLARLVTVENDPTVPAYARKVAADAVRAMEGES